MNGNVFKDDKKVAVSTNATNMNYSALNPTQYGSVVASDLIDFESEFDYYKNLSTYLSKLTPNGYTYSRDQINVSNGPFLAHDDNVFQTRFFDYIARTDLFGVSDSFEDKFTSTQIVLRGTNKNLNIFNVYNSIYDGTDIVLDVPYGSHVIINYSSPSVTFRSSEITGLKRWNLLSC